MKKTKTPRRLFVGDDNGLDMIFMGYVETLINVKSALEYANVYSEDDQPEALKKVATSRHNARELLSGHIKDALTLLSFLSKEEETYEQLALAVRYSQTFIDKYKLKDKIGCWP